MGKINRAVSMKLFTPRHRRIANQGVQRSTEASSTQRRKNERKALNLNAYGKLDKAQEYGETGDVIPIVFCQRTGGYGGAWIAPLLIDTTSENFNQTFVYLVSSGQITLPAGKGKYLFGKNTLRGVEEYAATTLTLTSHYTSDDTVCPISGLAVGCAHNTFKFLLDGLTPEVGKSVQFQTVDEYATAITVRAIPEYPDDLAPPTNLERYTITVKRLNNETGSSSTVGTFTTPATNATPVIFTNNPSTGSYTYTFTVTSVFSPVADKPKSILIEIKQENNFPSGLDRKASYVDMTLLSIQGNLYDPERIYSAPTELKQLNIFVENGISVDKWRFFNPSISNPGGFTYSYGASNRIADLLLYYLENSGKYPQAANYQVMLYTDIGTTALFHENYYLGFDGVINDTVNFASWVQQVAPMFLCKFFVFNGIFRLRPLLPLTNSGYISTAALTPVVTFTDSNLTADSTTGTIIAGSYQKTYTSIDDRRPFRIVVTFKKTSKYFVEVPTTAKVRYSDYAKNVPEESYDMSDFCTSDLHATLYAKYVLATRRYSTHRVSFQTVQNPNDLTAPYKPLDLIAVSIKREDSTGTNRTETNHYLIESLELDSTTGVTSVTATHFPLNGSAISIISNSIINGSFDVEV